jgi:hypothetical protein
MLFPALLRRALVVSTAINRLHTDAAYDSAENRRLCLAEGILPLIRKIGEPHGSGLGSTRCVVEHTNAWLLANKRSTVETTGWRRSLTHCWQQPAFSSSLTSSPISENRA